MFLEATLGLGLVALLITFLPSIYQAFSRREAQVGLLEVRAGSPPSAEGFLLLHHRTLGLEVLGNEWETWERWFVEIDESHVTHPALVFFRSPRPDRSWITAAGTVLDAASFTRACLDIPSNARADLCIRAGYLALRQICDYFHIPYDPDPNPDDPIAISREEFDVAYERLRSEGLPMKPDRDQAWRDFAGWRVNYDASVLGISKMVFAPFAPWNADRPPLGAGYERISRFGRRRRKSGDEDVELGAGKA